jgi:hypothetical protein
LKEKLFVTGAWRQTRAFHQPLLREAIKPSYGWRVTLALQLMTVARLPAISMGSFIRLPQYRKDAKAMWMQVD